MLPSMLMSTTSYSTIGSTTNGSNTTPNIVVGSSNTSSFPLSCSSTAMLMMNNDPTSDLKKLDCLEPCIHLSPPLINLDITFMKYQFNNNNNNNNNTSCLTKTYHNEITKSPCTIFYDTSTPKQHATSNNNPITTTNFNTSNNNNTTNIINSCSNELLKRKEAFSYEKYDAFTGAIMSSSSSSNSLSSLITTNAPLPSSSNNNNNVTSMSNSIVIPNSSKTYSNTNSYVCYSNNNHPIISSAHAMPSNNNEARSTSSKPHVVPSINMSANSSRSSPHQKHVTSPCSSNENSSNHNNNKHAIPTANNEQCLMKDVEFDPSCLSSSSQEDEVVEVPKTDMRYSPFKKIQTSDSGKVVINHGTWSKEEHDLFVQGLQEVGRNWDLIASKYIKSRVRSQVASHAQKYFKKVEKIRKMRQQKGTNGEVVYWCWDKCTFLDNNEYILLGKHASSIMCILYHPEHDLIITGSVDHSIKIFDPFGTYVTENTCLQTINSHNKAITCLTSHFDLIISGSADETIKIWKPDRERKNLNLHPWFICLKTLHDSDSWISSIWSNPSDLFSLDSSNANNNNNYNGSGSSNNYKGNANIGCGSSCGEWSMIVGDMRGLLYFYKSIGENRDRRDIIDIKLINKCRLREKGITKIIMLFGNNMLISCAFDNIVKFTDASGRTTFSQFEREERIISMAWNDVDEEVITVTENGKVEIYQYRTGDTINYSFYSGKEPCALTYCKEKEQLIISSRNVIQCFTIERNIPHKEFMEHEDAVLGICVNSKVLANGRLISCGADNKICLWEVSKLEMNCLEHVKLSFNNNNSVVNHYQTLTAVTVNAATTSMATSISTTTTTSTMVTEITSFVHIEGPFVCTGHDSGHIAIWNLEKNRECTIFKFHDNSFSEIYFGQPKDSHIIITSSFDGSFAVCDLVNFLNEKQYPIFKVKKEAHNGEVFCAILNPTNLTIISGGSDGFVRFWSIPEDFKLLTEIEVLKFSQLQQKQQNKVTRIKPFHLYKLQQQRRKRSSLAICSLLLTEDGLWVGSDDKTIRLYSSSLESSKSGKWKQICIFNCPANFGRVIGMKLLKDYNTSNNNNNTNNNNAINNNTSNNLNGYSYNSRILTWYRGGRIDIWYYDKLNNLQEVLFVYENSQVEFTFVDYDAERLDIFAGTESGMIIRIKTNNNNNTSEEQEEEEEEQYKNVDSNNELCDEFVGNNNNSGLLLDGNNKDQQQAVVQQLNESKNNNNSRMDIVGRINNNVISVQKVNTSKYTFSPTIVRMFNENTEDLILDLHPLKRQYKISMNIFD
ncbi:hypothetical protein ABK040_011279 [Willaertia magna]